MPRTAETQFAYVKASGKLVVSASQLEIGDLVFFGGDGYDGTPAAPGHVGIYIGRSQMIDAPPPVSMCGSIPSLRPVSSEEVRHEDPNARLSARPALTLGRGSRCAGHGRLRRWLATRAPAPLAQFSRRER